MHVMSGCGSAQMNSNETVTVNICVCSCVSLQMTDRQSGQLIIPYGMILWLILCFALTNGHVGF